MANSPRNFLILPHSISSCSHKSALLQDQPWLNSSPSSAVEEEEEKYSAEAAEEGGGNNDAKSVKPPFASYRLRCLRPQIRRDFQPHDFSTWQRSPNFTDNALREDSTSSNRVQASSVLPSIAKAASQDRNTTTTTASTTTQKSNKIPRELTLPSSLASWAPHLSSPVKPARQMRDDKEGRSVWSAKENEVPAKRVNKKRGGEEEDRRFYHNLVQMLPFLEPYMQEKHPDLHRRYQLASVIHTPAPTSEAAAKGKLYRSVPSKTKRMDMNTLAKDEEEVLRQVVVDDSTLAVCNSAVGKLSCRLKEEKKGWEQPLQPHSPQRRRRKNQELEIVRLSKRINELRQQLADTELAASLSQREKTSKSEEIALIWRQCQPPFVKERKKPSIVQQFLMNTDSEASKHSSCVINRQLPRREAGHINSLVSTLFESSQVLRNLANLSASAEVEVAAIQSGTKKYEEKMERVRKNYLATIIVAKQHPDEEEPFALLSIVRTQLHSLFNSSSPCNYGVDLYSFN